MFHQIIDFLNGSSLRYALTEHPVVYESLVRQFWTPISTRNLPNEQVELVATIDGHEHTISEATIRTAFHLDDLDAVDVLPNQEIFDGLQAIGYRPDGPWQYEGPAMPLLAAMLTQVAQSYPLEGPPIAPQADEPIPDPAHASNMEEPISSPVLEPNIASTSDPFLSEAQFDAFTDFEAQQHHDQPTGGSPTYENPPIPNPTTLPVSTTKGAAEKLEAKVKTKSKRKLVISDSEEEEAAKDYAELEKLIDLAEAVVNEPSSFVTPSKTTTPDSSQKEDISPSMVEAAQILTRGKLDPSKISKSPAAVTQRSVQTFVRMSSSKSTQRLDYSDVDFSPRDSVATDRSIPAEEVVPADKEIEHERLSMLEIDRLKAQDEEERKKRLADLSKSDSEYATQVSQTMETSHAEPAPQVPATSPLPSIQRQKDLDDMIARFSNTEWMILMARVKDFLEVAKEILGVDVNDDNFSSRLQDLVDKRKSVMSIQRYRAQQAKPMTRGDTVKFMRTYIKNMSAAYYSSGRTMEWANKFKGDDLIVEYNKIKSVVEQSTASQGVKRSGPTLAPGSPKKMKSTACPSLGYTSADEVPADTGVSTDETIPADQRVPADQSVPADASIPAGTCVPAKAATTTIPVNAPLEEDEPAEE
nr:xylulose kinase-1 [Tanacetum cinerariifolium]